MLNEQVFNRKLECQIKEIEQHLDQSFDKINNFIDQIFILDPPNYKTNNIKSEFSLPNFDQFNLIDQSQFQSNMVKQFTIQINKQQSHSKHQQSLLKSQSQLLQHKDNNIKSQSQLIHKPFNYQIIQDNTIQQQLWCYAFAFNKDCSIVAAGCNNQIIIYEFKKEILKQIQVLNQHQGNVLALNFMKKSNMLISGGGPGDNSIFIWQSNNNNQWSCSQKIQEHKDLIQCLIVNNNEDLMISGSDDQAIKFWVKQNEWICSQTITDHKSYIRQLSLNDQQNQVISCGYDNLILIIEYSEQNGNWGVIQKINVDCYGYRLCFINDYLFAFKPRQGNLMHVYEMNSVSKQFIKKKDIIVNQGDGCNILFPQQYIKSKQLIVNKHNNYINFIRRTENEDFKLEYSIQFGTGCLFGSLSDDGEYLITWDESSNEIQIRKYIEE